MPTQSLSVRQLTVKLDAIYRQTTFDGTKSNPSKFLHDLALTLANGTGAGMANFAWRYQPPAIAAGGNVVIDLSSLTDEFNNAITPSKLKLIIIQFAACTDAAATLSVGNAAANPWTGICSSGTALLPVRLGGWLAFGCVDATGFAIAGGSKNVKILNNGSAAATVNVIVVGEK